MRFEEILNLDVRFDSWNPALIFLITCWRISATGWGSAGQSDSSNMNTDCGSCSVPAAAMGCERSWLRSWTKPSGSSYAANNNRYKKNQWTVHGSQVVSCQLLCTQFGTTKFHITFHVTCSTSHISVENVTKIQPPKIALLGLYLYY